jgi:uncharacterized repeat protein (TIGR03803 family)
MDCLAAQTFDYSIVHSFGAPRMGVYIESPVLLDNKGDLYGTAPYGGTFGSGAVYEISSTGVERPIYSFTGGTDGGNPVAGLISDPDGNLFGVAEFGGDPTSHCGTIFKLDSSQNFSVLYTFIGNEAGTYRISALVRDRLGNLYGSSTQGGDSRAGTVFKLDPLGNLTVLREFAGPDGSYPNGLILDNLGNLYGTTAFGGTYGDGEVFKLDPAGHISILYSFAGGNDGAQPSGTLTRDSAGNLYGTTTYGGGSAQCQNGCGTVFRLNLPSRAETVLHAFTGADGEAPDAGPILDSTGNLYGTTHWGGILFGVVYMLDPSGDYSILHEFGTVPDGNLPAAGLIMDRAGNLFGTTMTGGAYSEGTVYKLTRQ